MLFAVQSREALSIGGSDLVRRTRRLLWASLKLSPFISRISRTVTKNGMTVEV